MGIAASAEATETGGATEVSAPPTAALAVPTSLDYSVLVGRATAVVAKRGQGKTTWALQAVQAVRVVCPHIEARFASNVIDSKTTFEGAGMVGISVEDVSTLFDGPPCILVIDDYACGSRPYRWIKDILKKASGHTLIVTAQYELDLPLQDFDVYVGNATERFDNRLSSYGAQHVFAVKTVQVATTPTQHRLVTPLPVPSDVGN